MIYNHNIQYHYLYPNSFHERLSRSKLSRPVNALDMENPFSCLLAASWGNY